jgi:ABC-type sugar transport system ATPase subunit
MSGVQLHQIERAFAQRRVLRDLELHVPTGQYVVLLGPSGCGKTTILRIIAGLESPDRGDVLIGGKRVNALAPRLRDVSMVFQDDCLYPHLTVAESIGFALRGRLAAVEQQARIAEAAELTKTESILDRYPSGLSGGELRRAALAKAIARRASVRLLDEPLSALDAPIRHGLQDDILRWHAAVPGTSIHVTHDGQEAMRMADQIAVLDCGQVVQMAPPLDVYLRPQTVAVAQAIGSPPIEWFPARLIDGIVRSQHAALSCQVALDRPGPDRDLQLGVRPDSWTVRTAEAAERFRQQSAGLVLVGRAVRWQAVQGELHVVVHSADESVLAVIPRSSLDMAGVGAETIGLTAPPSSLHLFDAASGRRLDVEPVG